MGNPIDPATYEFYQLKAENYTARWAEGHSRDLDAFLDRLAPASQVLELGCGGGQDSARMRQRGFVIDPTDGVPAMVDRANTLHQVGARLMQFDQLDAQNQYDGVWAQACLLHCPRAQLPAVIRAILRSLTSGGYHYASYKLGDGEGRDLLGRLHNFPGAGWLRSQYTEAGFEHICDEVYAGQASDGTQRDWIALTVRKP